MASYLSLANVPMDWFLVLDLYTLKFDREGGCRLYKVQPQSAFVSRLLYFRLTRAYSSGAGAQGSFWNGGKRRGLLLFLLLR